MSSHTATSVSQAGPVPANEAERIAALHSYHILDTAEDKDFDDLTTLAAVICQTPIALVSLVDRDRQWFKSHKGLPARETPREFSFCAHAIASPEHVMIVPDAKVDERFAANPLVTGETNITFYAGVPLVNSEGFALGSLCVIDHQSRGLSAEQVDALTVVAKQVIDKLDLKRKSLELALTNQSLQRVIEQLTSSEAQFRNLVDHAPVAIAVLTGPQFVIESANEQILALWHKPSTIIGKELAVALPELQGQPFLDLLANVYSTGKTYYGTEAKATLHSPGAARDSYYNFVYKPVSNYHQNTNAIFVVATEVTQQVDARNQVEESNERLQLALEAGSLGSYDVNMETGNMRCSEQCKKNYGLPANAAFNFPDLLACILPEDRDSMLAAVNVAITGNIIYQAEYRVKWPDGSIHWISAYGKVKPNADGHGLRVIGITQNISARKDLDKRKDEFLAIVSHELKTPITSLKASLQLLESVYDQPANKTVPVLVQTSIKSTGRIDKLVSDLLNMHRFSENELKLDKNSFDIYRLAELSSLHVQPAKNQQIIVAGDKGRMVCADEHRIEQVIVNFINNAVKYAPHSPNIVLTISQLPAAVKVAVQDWGPGIAQEDLPHLFDRYWRADQDGKHYNGLGLGLYICAEIIKRHNGEIGASAEKGKGSIFWFTLPA